MVFTRRSKAVVAKPRAENPYHRRVFAAEKITKRSGDSETSSRLADDAPRLG